VLTSFVLGLLLQVWVGHRVLLCLAGAAVDGCNIPYQLAHRQIAGCAARLRAQGTVQVGGVWGRSGGGGTTTLFTKLFLQFSALVSAAGLCAGVGAQCYVPVRGVGKWCGVGARGCRGGAGIGAQFSRELQLCLLLKFVLGSEHRTMCRYMGYR
jgi:hypothetical protein